MVNGRSKPPEPPGTICVDVEWKFIQAFANFVLRKGMEREAERMIENMREERRYLAKIKSRRIREAAYAKLREERDGL